MPKGEACPPRLTLFDDLARLLCDCLEVTFIDGRAQGVSLHSVRVMGPDGPSIAAELTQKLADGEINLRRFSIEILEKA